MALNKMYSEKTVRLYLHYGILRMSDSAMVQSSNKRYLMLTKINKSCFGSFYNGLNGME